MTAINTVGAQQISALDLGEMQPKQAATTAGMREATHEVWVSERGSTGVWECSVGDFTAAREGYTEICYLLTGSVTVTTKGGESVLYKAGDIVVMPSGWQGVWQVHEPVRKHYTIIND